MNDEIIKLALSYSLASDIHEKWRSSRKKDDGTYEPRLKKSTDEIWNTRHGTNEVDIANCSFSELPSNWQYENLEAAKVAIDLVYDKTMSFDPITFEELDQLSTIVHDEWLKRNSWVYDPNYGNPLLAVPYNRLSKEEQNKDKDHIFTAQEKIMNYLNGYIDVEELCQQYNIVNNKHLSKN